MSDSDEDKNDNVPDVKICEDRCNEFAEVTSTDTACAQFFLHGTDWDLSRAIDAYFDSVLVASDSERKKRNDIGTSKKCNDDALMPRASSKRLEASTTVADCGRSSVLANKQPAGDNKSPAQKNLQFITWNIDGLGENSMKLRIKRVCEIINFEQPVVVHLQEVTPYVYSYMQEKLSTNYKLIEGNHNPKTSDYFVMTLLKKTVVDYESRAILEFPGSVMDRTLLIVKVRIGDVPYMFLNSHFESTQQFAEERKRQLSTAFKIILQCDPSRTVIFAGDLNLRDKELDAIGGLPTGIEDLWIMSGKRDELKFTWDAQRNNNIDIPNGRFARCRFDRAYLKQANGGCSGITLKHFGFVGIEKISDCGRFPSDHWGLSAVFVIEG